MKDEFESSLHSIAIEDTCPFLTAWYIIFLYSCVAKESDRTERTILSDTPKMFQKMSNIITFSGSIFQSK